MSTARARVEKLERTRGGWRGPRLEFWFEDADDHSLFHNHQTGQTMTEEQIAARPEADRAMVTLFTKYNRDRNKPQEAQDGTVN